MEWNEKKSTIGNKRKIDWEIPPTTEKSDNEVYTEKYKVFFCYILSSVFPSSSSSFFSLQSFPIFPFQKFKNNLV